MRLPSSCQAKPLTLTHTHFRQISIWFSYLGPENGPHETWWLHDTVLFSLYLIQRQIPYKWCWNIQIQNTPNSLISLQRQRELRTRSLLHQLIPTGSLKWANKAFRLCPQVMWHQLSRCCVLIVSNWHCRSLSLPNLELNQGSKLQPFTSKQILHPHCVLATELRVTGNKQKYNNSSTTSSSQDTQSPSVLTH